MTEEEAKTKWCPMAPVREVSIPIGHNISQNMLGMMPQGAQKCIGAACMMWREQLVRERVSSDEVTDSNMVRVTGVMWIRDRTIGGYCGLAGVPHQS